MPRNPDFLCVRLLIRNLPSDEPTLFSNVCFWAYLHEAFRNGSQFNTVHYVIWRAGSVALHHGRPGHGDPPERGRPEASLWPGTAGLHRINRIPRCVPPREIRTAPVGHHETVTSPRTRIYDRGRRSSPQKNRVLAPQPADTLEAVSELGGHQIVQNRVDGRVEVQHDSAEVKDVVVPLHTQAVHLFRGHEYEPEGEDPERDETDEEQEDYSAQHEDHLLSGTRVAAFGFLDGHHDGIGH